VPQPRKPTAILEASGAFIKHPERRAARKNEPKPTGKLGAPPSFLSAEEKKIWKELEGIITPGVLGNSDRWAIEIACNLMAKRRDGSIKTQELSMLLSLLGRLGMTPADRSKVAGVPEQPGKKEDPWSSYLDPGRKEGHA
jgi:phage terminase small subunit